MDDEQKGPEKQLVIPLGAGAAINRFAGQRTFLARSLVVATLPHDNPGEGITHWERVNGNYRLLIQADPALGLPYGVYPRLFLTWLCREVKRTNSRELELGLLTPFLENLGLAKGGRTARDFLNQAERLLGSRMAFKWLDDINGQRGEGRRYMQLANGLQLWTPRTEHGELYRAGAAESFPAFVELSHAFFEEIRDHSVPLNMEVIAKIKNSTLKLDIYFWLTYRTATMRGSMARIPWDALAGQFGSNYSNLRQFRYEFKKAMADVLKHYPGARAEASTDALILLPGQPSVARQIENP
jgi:hypothetical protein